MVHVRENVVATDVENEGDWFPSETTITVANSLHRLMSRTLQTDQAHRLHALVQRFDIPLFSRESGLGVLIAEHIEYHIVRMVSCKPDAPMMECVFLLYPQYHQHISSSRVTKRWNARRNRDRPRVMRVASRR